MKKDKQMPEHLKDYAAKVIISLDVPLGPAGLLGVVGIAKVAAFDLDTAAGLSRGQPEAINLYPVKRTVNPFNCALHPDAEVKAVVNGALALAVDWAKEKGLVNEFSVFMPFGAQCQGNLLTNKDRADHGAAQELMKKTEKMVAGAQELKRAMMEVPGAAYVTAAEEDATRMAKCDRHQVQARALAFQMALLTAYALVTCIAISSTNMTRK